MGEGATGPNTFGARSSLEVGGQTYEIYRIDAVAGSERLPFTHKVLLENLLRTEDGANVTAEQISALGSWDPAAAPTQEIQFTPARVIMQDFTGVPVVVDLATMREAVADLGGDPATIAFCEEIGLDYVSASPFRVPIARLAAAQAALAPL